VTQIQIGFSYPKRSNPFSSVIRLLFGSRFSHVYVRFLSDDFGDVVFQASGLAVNFMSFARFSEHNITVFEMPVTVPDDYKNEMYIYMMKTLGIPYGIRQAIGLGCVRVLELVGIRVRNPFSDRTATYVCSEVVGYVLQKFTHIKIPSDKTIDDLTPNDIYEIIKRDGENNIQVS
jgi:hypothetical protein